MVLITPTAVKVTILPQWTHHTQLTKAQDLMTDGLSSGPPMPYYKAETRYITMVVLFLSFHKKRFQTPHKPGFLVWKLRKARTGELISNLSTESQPISKVHFCKYLHSETTGKWFTHSWKEHATGVVGPFVKRIGSNLSSTMSP